MNFWEFCNKSNGLVFGVVLLIALCIMTISMGSCQRANVRQYTANGYHEVQRQGTTETMWQKK